MEPPRTVLLRVVEKALCNATEDKVADEKLGLLTALSKGI